MFLHRFSVAQVCLSLLLPLLLLPLLLGAAKAQVTDGSGTEATETARIQVVKGRISSEGLQLYRVTGPKKGEVLFVHAKTTSGYLDPLIFLLEPGADPAELARKPLDDLVKTLSGAHRPIEVTRQILDRYALAGNDDYAPFTISARSR